MIDEEAAAALTLVEEIQRLSRDIEDWRVAFTETWRWFWRANFCDVAEAARLLGMRPARVRWLLRRERLAGLKMGRKWWAFRASVEAIKRS